MKLNNNSKKNFKHSEIEKKDASSLLGKGVKKDKSAKKRLSIYDEFDEEQLDDDFDFNDEDSEDDYDSFEEGEEEDDDDPYEESYDDDDQDDEY